MAKKSSSKRNTVNFQNKKVQSIISYLQIAENRISKEEILQLANKDIFYQLKNSGFIKETSKGNFQGTPKLHKEIKASTGKHFSTSASMEHSSAIRNSLKYIPSAVLDRKSFNTSHDIEKQFNRYKQSQEYKDSYSQLLQEKIEIQETIKQNEGFIPQIDYINASESIAATIELFEQGKPYLIPDYEITLTGEELIAYINNLEEAQSSYDDSTHQYQYLSDALHKLKSLDVTSEVTISIEIITDSYANREIEMHRTYEQLSNSTQIMLYAP